ncbi:D-alanyl-D-alanine carboxypeptidase/D-alanyl-D-alanine-endopeptidase [Salinivibrio sp. ES.052]|uniref:D-alanyl-D-alanine carboxypeptidase/D-alanyl-D-alanine endopeptidase n=1 Tax=Salinivibrio sp. ES.052 TaxID=1882823 RepID=UPI00092BE50B|nr:D-alanyl-D-alanine carboxypeptidase/D-alanyl-D-alanine-endopeptidase [Salinivibrio sp. ES.052]SIN72425.1 D-alanyl-D-alanine carboxypeptidase / D-alanyl-D-alanine-endopeptidase (penicillin-binding protein 4) [Salinivibrio sp. ES.052]
MYPALFRRLALVVMLVAPCAMASGESLRLEQLTPLLPKGSQLALWVSDAQHNQPQISEQADALLPPASTQKLLTGLAARLYLPSTFRFSTRLVQAGDDIALIFNGDPLLTRKDIRQLLSQLPRRGINNINNLYLDGQAFTGRTRAPGWPWDILAVCYSAPSTAITLNHNCVQGAIYSQPERALTRVHIPAHQPISVTSQARAVTESQQNKSHCGLDLTATPENHYHFSGCLAHRSGPLPLNFAVQTPSAYVKAIVAEELARLNVRVKGDIRVARAPSQARELARHHSAKLATLLTTMLRDSDNLIADNLLKALGRRYFQQPGSYRNGVAAVKAILQDEGIDLSRAVLVDGSGLSRNNRLSARQLSQVVHYILTHPELGLAAMLPTSGIDGTLKYRQSVRHAPIKGRLKAKSGSLYGSFNLAGVIEDDAKQTHIVIQLISHYHPDKDALPDNVPAPITQFEREFYLALIRGQLMPSLAITQP